MCFTYCRPQHIRKVHFENSPAPCSSPEEEKNYYSKISAAAGMATPSQNQSVQVLPDRQTPVTSLSTDMTIPQSPDIKNIKQEKQDEHVPQSDEGVVDTVTAGNLPEAGDINSTEYTRGFSDTSSLSESVYVRADNNKVRNLFPSPSLPEVKLTQNVVLYTIINPDREKWLAGQSISYCNLKS